MSFLDFSLQIGISSGTSQSQHYIEQMSYSASVFRDFSCGCIRRICSRTPIHRDRQVFASDSYCWQEIAFGPLSREVARRILGNGPHPLSSSYRGDSTGQGGRSTGFLGSARGFGGRSGTTTRHQEGRRADLALPTRGRDAEVTGWRRLPLRVGELSLSGS